VDAWLLSLARTLLDVGVAEAFLLFVVVLLMVGSRQPARRCGLARAAILGSLFLPICAASRIVPRIDLPQILRPFALPAPPWDEIDREVEVGNPFDPSAYPSLPRALAVGYLVGATAAAAWLALGYIGLAWVTAKAAAPSEASVALHESLPYEGRGRRPRILVSPRVRRPVLVGLFRSTILIPPDLDHLESLEPLRLSLLHELVHAERRDPWFAFLGGLAQAAWFFLPPMWWIRLQMRLDQEFLADRNAARGFGGGCSYATSLLNLADGRPTLGREQSAKGLPAGGFRGFGSALFLRVLMLVRCPFPMEPHTPAWWRWTFPPVLGALTIVLSGVTFHSAEAVSKPNSASQQFNISKVVLTETAAGPDGRGRPYTLPHRLPRAFDLNVEVRTDVQSLRKIRIAGIPLSQPTDPNNPPYSEAERWRKVRIQRAAGATRLWIDGRAQPPPTPSRPTPWLSLQGPPGQTIQFRNFVVTW
jgi:BlaR1 peptidase M56